MAHRPQEAVRTVLGAWARVGTRPRLGLQATGNNESRERRPKKVTGYAALALDESQELDQESGRHPERSC